MSNNDVGEAIVEPPVITFHALNRTFYRVLKDQSLNQLRDVVRKKLSLGKNVSVHLAQLLEGKTIDLDDDEDFEAFCTLARQLRSVNVSVTISEKVPTTPGPRLGFLPDNLTAGRKTKKLKKRLITPTATPGPSSQHVSEPYVRSSPSESNIRENPIASTSRGVSIDTAGASSSRVASNEERQKKKRKRKSLAPSTSEVATLGDAPSTVESNTNMSSPVKKKRKLGHDESGRDATATNGVPPPVSIPDEVEIQPRSKHPKRPKEERSKQDKKKRHKTKLSNESPITTTPSHLVDEELPNIGTSQAPPDDDTMMFDATVPSAKKKKGKKGSVAPSAETTMAPPTVQTPVVESPSQDVAITPPLKKKKSHKSVKASAEEQPVPAIPDPEPTLAASSVPPESSEHRPKKKSRKSKQSESAAGGSMEAVATETANFSKVPEVPDDEVVSKKGVPKKNPEPKGIAEERRTGAVLVADVHEAFKAVMSKLSFSLPAGDSLAGPSTPSVNSDKPASRSKKTSSKGNKIADAGANPPVRNLSSSILKALGPPQNEVTLSAPPVTKKSRKRRETSCPTCGAIPSHSRDECPSVVAESTQGHATEPQVDSPDTRSTEDQRTSLEADQTMAQDAGPIDDVRLQGDEPSVSTSTSKIVKPPLSAGTWQANNDLLAKIPFIRSSMIPAGSEVSEVIVEGQDEGSSNESSSSDDEELPDVGIAGPRAEDLLDISVEDLLRGPVQEGSILAQIPSSTSSEGEDDQESEQEDADDDERLDAEYRRLSQRLTRGNSSSDEEDAGDIDAEDQGLVPSTSMEIDIDNAVDKPLGDQEPVTASEEATVVPSEDGEGLTAEPEVVPVAEPEKPPSTVDEEPERLSAIINDESEKNVNELLNESFQSIQEDVPMINADLEPDLEQSQVSDNAPLDPLEPPAADAHETISPVATPSAKEEQPLVAEHSEITLGSPVKPIDSAIEPASDSLPKSNGVQVDDRRAGSHTPPPRTQTPGPQTPGPQTPGRAKRMRDRFGRIPHHLNELPILASDLSQAPYQSTPLTRRMTRASAQANATPAPEPIEPTARRTRASASMPPPPVPEPAETAPKRRGAKLTEAEKAQREEARAQERARKAEEKAQKAAEKAAEKARKAEEKEAEKRKKAEEKKQKGRKSTASVSTSAPPESLAPSDDVDVPAPTTPNLEAVPAVTASQSTVKWTTLSQEASVVEGDMTMIDELRSSSPGGSQLQPDYPMAVDAFNASAHSEASEAEETTVEAKIEAASQSVDAGRSESPLFLPTDSQYPATQGFDLAARQTSPAASASAQSGSEEEIQSSLARPVRQVNWTVKAPFRRLSDLASQQLFSPANFSNMSFPMNGQSIDGTPDTTMGGADSETEEDSDDSHGGESGSDDDADKSHIPQHRRAGSNMTKKKKSGLLALA